MLEDGLLQGIVVVNEFEKVIFVEGFEIVVMFIVEFVQGVGGVILLQDDYFLCICEICDKYDVFLVVDEVIIGFGCIGKMFGLEYWGIQFDLL